MPLLVYLLTFSFRGFEFVVEHKECTMNYSPVRDTITDLCSNSQSCDLHYACDAVDLGSHALCNNSSCVLSFDLDPMFSYASSLSGTVPITI